MKLYDAQLALARSLDATKVRVVLDAARGLDFLRGFGGGICELANEVLGGKTVDANTLLFLRERTHLERRRVEQLLFNMTAIVGLLRLRLAVQQRVGVGLNSCMPYFVEEWAEFRGKWISNEASALAREVEGVEAAYAATAPILVQILGRKLKGGEEARELLLSIAKKSFES